MDNVQLDVRLGIESMDYYFNPSNYTIQIDSCTEDDLKETTEGGAEGNWDAFFMDYYGPDGEGKDDPNHERYTIDEWECGEIHLDGTGSNTPIGFEDFTITRNAEPQGGLYLYLPHHQQQRHPGEQPGRGDGGHLRRRGPLRGLHQADHRR